MPTFISWRDCKISSPTIILGYGGLRYSWNHLPSAVCKIHFFVTSNQCFKIANWISFCADFKPSKKLEPFLLQHYNQFNMCEQAFCWNVFTIIATTLAIHSMKSSIHSHFLQPFSRSKCFHIFQQFFFHKKVRSYQKSQFFSIVMIFPV